MGWRTQAHKHTQDMLKGYLWVTCYPFPLTKWSCLLCYHLKWCHTCCCCCSCCSMVMISQIVPVTNWWPWRWPAARDSISNLIAHSFFVCFCFNQQAQHLQRPGWGLIMACLCVDLAVAISLEPKTQRDKRGKVKGERDRKVFEVLTLRSWWLSASIVSQHVQHFAIYAVGYISEHELGVMLTSSQFPNI